MGFLEIISVLGALSGEPVDPERHFGAIATGGHDTAAPIEITACPKPIGTDEVEGQTIICGTVSVPEDHDAPEGARIELVFSMLKSRSQVPEPDSFVYLHGGPGLGNMNGLQGLADLFDGWRQTRDVITFDQRAAGLSTGEAACQGVINTQIRETVTGQLSGEFVGACVAELKASEIALAQYNTLQNALDVPMVMGALGYESYNIIGISYGSKLALEVMRSAPEGVRSVILDGVAPPWLPLYDTLAVPMNDSMVRLVADCAADAACDAAYPALGEVLAETLDAALAGTLAGADGTAITAEEVLEMFAQRAGPQNIRAPSLTPYLPAMIYEYARLMDDPALPTPTIDMVKSHGYVLPSDPVEAVRQSARDHGGGAEILIQLGLSQALRSRETEREVARTMRALRDAVGRERGNAPLAELLDREFSRTSEAILADEARLVPFARDFATMIDGAPTAAALSGFIETHYDGAPAARLLALVEAMSADEITAFFEATGGSIFTTTYDFLTTTDLWIYACQEDVPFNSLDGYRALTAGLEYPQTDAFWGGQAGLLLAAVCPMFDPSPRAGWHEVVTSDIPTLSLGSTWDIQTSFNWADAATEGLANAQAFVIPEAGHGAVLYSACARDMAESFVNDPSRRFAEGTCATDVVPPFHIADWAGAGR